MSFTSLNSMRIATSSLLSRRGLRPFDELDADVVGTAQVDDARSAHSFVIKGYDLTVWRKAGAPARGDQGIDAFHRERDMREARIAGPEPLGSPVRRPEILEQLE